MASTKAEYFTTIPDRSCWEIDPDAAYLHYTANETIGGVEFQEVPEVEGIPLVSDMSSNLLSRPLDVGRLGLIYAGAQKSMGPAGIAVVIIREDLIGNARTGTPSISTTRSRLTAAQCRTRSPPAPDTFLAWYCNGSGSKEDFPRSKLATAGQWRSCIRRSMHRPSTPTRWSLASVHE